MHYRKLAVVRSEKPQILMSAFADRLRHNQLGNLLWVVEVQIDQAFSIQKACI